MELREKIAEIEHKQWVHWTRYFLNNLTPENLERWKRQCDTPYSELTKIEKDADRRWADQILALINSKTVEFELEHKQCHSCISWIYAEVLGSYCNHNLVRGVNKDGKCAGYDRKT